MRYTLILSLVLTAFWFVMSGHFDALLIGLGLGSVALVVLLVRRMRIVDSEGAPYGTLPGKLTYVPWLLWQILLSNLHVALLILDPRLPIRPQVVQVPTRQDSDLGRAVFANSITLTPGTVSMRLRETEITVHALTTEAADGLSDGEMDRRAKSAVGAS